MPMTPRQLETYLQALLQEVLETRDILGMPATAHGNGKAASIIASVETFEETELVTDEKGLLITTEDGWEFRIVIRRGDSARQR